MPVTDFEAEKSNFKEYFSKHAELLRGAAESLRTLLSLLLTDHDGFPTPQVVSRVKDRDECIAKFARKYQAQCEASNTQYQIKDYITDLVGLRVVCLYESDIQQVRAVLAESFEVVAETDKTQAIETQEGVFGYKGVHLDLRLNSARRELPEYRRFHDLRFEVQLRTIVQDAWSVLDHKIKYKKSIPHPLKRRINRLAALFELADQEFLNIRDETRRLELEELPVGQPAVAVSPAEPEPLNAFSFVKVMAARYPTYNFIDHKVDGFVAELLTIDPTLTAAGVNAALESTQSTLARYKAYQFERFRNRLNPYTAVRHSLYFSNPQRFAQVLFELQRQTFDDWLLKGEPA